MGAAGASKSSTTVSSSSRACGTVERWAARLRWSSRTETGPTGRAGWNRAGARAAAPVTRLRPGHADLAGVVKYGLNDIRDVLERASARETASRVAAGGLSKAFLRQFGIEVRSHVRSIGTAQAEAPAELDLARDGAAHPWWQAVEESPIRTGDHAFEEAAIELIKAARTAGDTLGGIFEVIAYGVPIGLGTYGQWDERLDGRLAAAIMSIQSLKGVEIGDAFANAGRYGSRAHDVIDYDPAAGGWTRPTNHAGGLEGGVSNGMPLSCAARQNQSPH